MSSVPGNRSESTRSWRVRRRYPRTRRARRHPPRVVPDVSVVVPVYNRALHLAECAQSVLDQRGVSLELLCVDDRSTDDSWEMLRRLRKADRRVRLVRHSDNLGLAAARNTGIEHARGRYVQFTDPGDLLPPGALNALHQGAVAMGAQAVRGLPQHLEDTVCTTGNEGRRGTAGLPKWESNQEIRVGSLIDLAELWIPCFCACFLYSSELLSRRDIRYPALTCGEDLVFLAHALTAADKICVVPEVAYTYRIWDPRPPASFDGVRDYFAHAEMVKHIYGRRFRACWEAYEPYIKNDLAMLAEGAALDEHESRWAACRLRRFSTDCRVPSLSAAEHDVDEDERASQPALSVVIPSRNAEQHLGHQLDALMSQETSFRWELIVVDNGSTDRSVAVAESYADRRPVRSVPAPERPNQAYARNVGVRAAIADKLVFVDADDQVAPGFLAAIYDALGEHEFVTSPDDEVFLNPAWSQRAHAMPSSTHGLGKFIMFPPRAGSAHPVQPDKVPQAYGCAIGITRQALRSVGGCPEEYNDIWDLALSIKLHQSGVVLAYLPGPLIRYRLRGSLPGLFRQTRRWGCYQARAHREFGRQVMPSRSARVAITEWTTAIKRLLTASSRAELAQCAVRFGWCVGRLQGSVRYRTLYL
jgi:glycosyltransferase involved in cell wall biosynthesis